MEQRQMNFGDLETEAGKGRVPIVSLDDKQPPEHVAVQTSLDIPSYVPEDKRERYAKAVYLLKYADSVIATGNVREMRQLLIDYCRGRDISHKIGLKKKRLNEFTELELIDTFNRTVEHNRRYVDLIRQWHSGA